MNKFFNLLILFSTLLLSSKVHAYPNFIGHGYNSCITCHYNPFGNGPINDYGRAVSGTAIGSRIFYDAHKPEDLIAKETGFFFQESTSKHFRPSLNYRGLLLRRNLGQDSAVTDFIHMQADANLVAKFGKKDQFFMSGTFGYAPVPLALQKSPGAGSIKTYRTREHYVAWRPITAWGIYAGLLDKTYGIRVVEHTSYARTTPQMTMDDQSHGIIVHYNNPKYEGGFNVFVGNLAQEAPLRMKGFAGTFEYTLLEKNRVGMSLMSEQNDYLKLNALATHVRAGLSGGNSIIFEMGKVTKTTKQTGADKKEYYANLQNHIETARGVYILNSVEYYKNAADNSYRVRFGPGLQFFPMSKVEFRTDLYNTRSFTNSSSSPDRWDLMAQIHLWL